MKRFNCKKWILLGIACVIVISLVLIYTRIMTVPFLYRHRAGNWYTIGTLKTNCPLDIDTSKIKTISFEQFNHHPKEQFNADPFLIKDDSVYYIFFENMPAKTNSTWGDIGVIKSTDLKNWEHLGIVLDEPFHLSYPNVFKYKDKWYMIPESTAANQVRLYQSDRFPYQWKLHSIIMDQVKIADPSLIFKNDTLYLLGEQDGKLALYYSHDLFSKWEKHPGSPIRDYDSRPGGRPGEIDGKTVYFIQNHSEGYGTGLFVYEIDSISTSYFKDHKLDKNPVLWKGTQSGWNSSGMHHLSWVALPDGTYYCVMDGSQRHGVIWGWDWLNFPVFRFNQIGKTNR